MDGWNGVRSSAALVASFVVVGFLTACVDDELPLGPGVEANDGDAQPQLVQALAQVRPMDGYMVDRAEQPGDWLVDSDALARELAANGGGATVFFKDPATARFFRAGVGGGRAFRSGVSAAAVTAGLRLLDEQGVKLGTYLWRMAAVLAVIPPDAAEAIATSPVVDFVAPSHSSHRLDGSAPRVPRALSKFAFGETTPWGITAVKAPLAWAKTTGDGASVLIIDSGYDNGHPDLPKIPAGNCLEDGTCGDPIGHGTLVAGVLAALDNSEGVVGVAPGIKPEDLYLYEVCSEVSTPSGPRVECQDTLIAKGLIEAANRGIDVVNMSLSGPVVVEEVVDAVGAAAAAGVVMVAAAGRHCHEAEGCFPGTDNEERYPAAYSDVIAISGVNPNLTFAHSPDERPPSCGGLSSNFSTGSMDISVSAPIEGLTTQADPFDRYEVVCGTSFSAPHVAGVAALIRALSPSLPAWQVEQRMEITAVDLGPTGEDPGFGAGLVDARAATGPHVSVEGPEPESELPMDATCEWTATALGGVNPMTFEWYKDGDLVGTGSTVELETEPGESFQLELIVEDAQFFQGTWVEEYDVSDGFETFVGSSSSLGGGSEFCEESGGDGIQ